MATQAHDVAGPKSEVNATVIRLREQIAKDTRAFLASGGEIQKLSDDATGLDRKTGNRIGSLKQRRKLSLK